MFMVRKVNGTSAESRITCTKLSFCMDREPWAPNVAGCAPSPFFLFLSISPFLQSRLHLLPRKKLSVRSWFWPSAWEVMFFVAVNALYLCFKQDLAIFLKKMGQYWFLHTGTQNNWLLLYDLNTYRTSRPIKGRRKHTQPKKKRSLRHLSFSVRPFFPLSPSFSVFPFLILVAYRVQFLLKQL